MYPCNNLQFDDGCFRQLIEQVFFHKYLWDFCPQHFLRYIWKHPNDPFWQHYEGVLNQDYFFEFCPQGLREIYDWYLLGTKYALWFELVRKHKFKLNLTLIDTCNLCFSINIDFLSVFAYYLRQYAINLVFLINMISFCRNLWV